MLGFWKATNILKDIILGEEGVIRDKRDNKRQKNINKIFTINLND